MSNFTFYQKLLLNFFVTTIFVSVSYFFWDKPIAFAVHGLQFPGKFLLIWITHLKPILYYFAVISLMVAFFVSQKINKIDQQNFIWIFCLSILLSNEFKMVFKFLFGRAWPETWIHKNFSLIQNHFYGFTWMHAGRDYAAFPSGHMTITCAAIAVFWIYFPKLKFLLAMIVFAMGASLLLMNYHFLSDIVAGCFLGFSTAFCVNQIINKDRCFNNINIAMETLEVRDQM